MSAPAKAPSTIMDRLRAGRPLDHIPVLDLHTHMGSSSRFYYVPYSGAEQVGAYLDRYGVDHILTFALSTTTDPEVKNTAVYRWHELLPGRVSTLTTLHAAFPEDWLALLEQGAARGSRGIKLLGDYQGVEELAVDWTAALDFARSRRWLVLNHDWKHEEHLGEYAEAYPEVTFVIGHPTLPFRRRETILSRLENVYQSTCAAFVTPGFSLMSLEDMYRRLPLERILFGSDALDLDLGTALGPVAYADIPEEAKQRILGGNALELARKLDWGLESIERRYGCSRGRS